MPYLSTMRPFTVTRNVRFLHPSRISVMEVYLRKGLNVILQSPTRRQGFGVKRVEPNGTKTAV